MQAMTYFSENYVEPLMNHSVTQYSCKVIVEGVKVVAVKAFLEYLGDHYLNNPKKISRWVIREETVWAPIKEELLFRFVILKGMHLFQKCVKRSSIQLASTLYDPPEQKSEGVHQKHPILIYLPLEYDLIYQAIKKGVKWINNLEELTDNEESEKVQSFFRIHFTALIFAAAHLINPHPNKISALTQFIGSYIGGLAYGYLTEKYQSLAPAIFFHGIHNCLADAGNIYSKEMIPLLITAIVVNRVVSFLLGLTQIDTYLLSHTSQTVKHLFNWQYK